MGYLELRLSINTVLQIFQFLIINISITNILKIIFILRNNSKNIKIFGIYLSIKIAPYVIKALDIPGFIPPLIISTPDI